MTGRARGTAMPPMDVMDLLTLGGSAASMAITAYFWLVRSRRESPDLRFFVVSPLDGDQSRGRADATLDCHVVARCVVANYSMLPDTLIRIRAWLQLASGEWVESRPATGDRAPYPMNIAAMHSTLVVLEMTFTAKGDLSGTTSLERRNASLAHLATPPRIRVEMQGLSPTPHTVEAAVERPALVA